MSTTISLRLLYWKGEKGFFHSQTSLSGNWLITSNDNLFLYKLDEKVKIYTFGIKLENITTDRR